MKKIIFVFLTLLNTGCMYTSEQEGTRRENPPVKYFTGKDLKMGQAIYKDDVKTIEYLIKQEHYDVNGRGSYKDPNNQDYPDSIRYTYLNYAVWVGKIKSVEKLLELGADINMITDEGGGYYSNINLACYNHNRELIRLLVKHGENLNSDLSESPISLLLRNGGKTDKEMIDLLLRNGADVNHKEYFSGDTPVLTAFALGKSDYINYFLDKGADPMTLDYTGNCLALLIQEEITEGRLKLRLDNDSKIKDRLINRYHIKFPLKNEYKKGLEASIQRYESLSQADKDLLGKNEVDRIQLFEKWIKNGATDNGIKLND